MAENQNPPGENPPADPQKNGNGHAPTVLGKNQAKRKLKEIAGELGQMGNTPVQNRWGARQRGGLEAVRDYLLTHFEMTMEEATEEEE